ncbi:hypothetical protein Aple_080000 [Acrocarpospora pleiomorpha]|uniref:DUF4352 domain-containing protein n=1 Tax=Acrocarpospora pleiomorpha TaxID=90975 RepID=A0A5M3XZX7_9ACTN|nr:DUF4352 domain-containing protein [Acrocarpospora pleiomorpha]GES25101.1 hypothetical protein Aple_080000 [Acrocarpospora pleiomorpha]
MSQYPQGPQQYGPHGYYYPPQPPPPRKSSTPLILLVLGIFIVVVAVSAGVLVAINRSTVTAEPTTSATPRTSKTVRTAGTGDETEETAEPEETVRAAGTGDETEETAAPAEGAQRLGRAIELHGIAPETVVQVTARRIIAPARPANQYIVPKAGSQYIAVELILKNVGEKLYNDAPTNSGKLIDVDGQQYNAAFAEVRDGVSLNGMVTVSVGDSRKGVLVYEVPKGTKLAKYQFVLDSGYGKDQGEWMING